MARAGLPGLATEIPSHNLREIADARIALIKNPSTARTNCWPSCPVPTTPAAGRSSAAHRTLPTPTARARLLKVRARWKIEELARGQWQLVVNELPPGVSTQKVLEEIEEITNPKPKTGKKALSQEQTSSRPACWRCWTWCATSPARTRPRAVFEPKTARRRSRI